MMSYKVARERQEDCFLFVKLNSQIVKLNLQIINLQIVKRRYRTWLEANDLTENTIKKLVFFQLFAIAVWSQSVMTLHEGAMKNRRRRKTAKFAHLPY